MTTYRAVAAPSSRTLSSDRLYRVAASVCAIIAGIVHAAVAPEHFAESWYVGAFFLVVAAGQVGLAVALRWALRPSIVIAAILGNLAVIALYVASRTVELSFLPEHHDSSHTVEHLPVAGAIGNGIPVFPGSRIEPVGLPDLVCLAAELTLVVMLVGLLGGRQRQLATNAMLCLGLLALLTRGVGLLA